MAEAASSADLTDAILKHHAETQIHVQRLEQVFGILDQPVSAKKCEAMAGLSAEGDRVVAEVDDEAVRDRPLRPSETANAEALQEAEDA